jgi:hypothetical protein
MWNVIGDNRMLEVFNRFTDGGLERHVDDIISNYDDPKQLIDLANEIRKDYDDKLVVVK